MGQLFRHLFALCVLVGIGARSNGEFLGLPTNTHIVYCTVTATLNGVRIRVDEPNKLTLVNDNMTECGRLVSPERNNLNVTARLLVLRKRPEMSYSNLMDLCSKDEASSATPISDEPTIVVASRSNPSCDTNAKYRAASGLRDRLRNLKGLFLVGTSDSVRSKIIPDPSMNGEVSDLPANIEFPIFQSDSSYPGLLNMLKNLEDNERAYLPSRSQQPSLFEDQGRIVTEPYSMELSIWIVYGRSVPSNGSPLSISKTSILFVAVSFMTLMLVSLAWLLVYYVQRFRYVHAKDRLARRLANAARKALARIPTRTLRAGDCELASDETVCAICIEPYALDQLVRTLPCRHTFHRSCVDTWLLEQRSCPVCKFDILKAFGAGTLRSASGGSSAEPAPDTHHLVPLGSSEVPAASTSSATAATATATATASQPASSVHVVLTHAEIVPHIVDETAENCAVTSQNGESESERVQTSDMGPEGTYSAHEDEPAENASLMDSARVQSQ